MKNVSLESVPPYFFKSKFLRLDQAVSSSTFRLWPFAVSITVLQYQIPLFKRFDYRFLFALDPQSSDDRKSLCEGMFGRSASLNPESTQLWSFHSVRHDRCESQSQRFNFDE